MVEGLKLTISKEKNLVDIVINLLNKKNGLNINDSVVSFKNMQET